MSQPRPLPLRVNLEWLKKLCKDRLDELRASDPSATLSDVQLSVAREYGFPSWRQLKAHVEQVREDLDAVVPPELLRNAASDIVAPDDPELGELLVAVRDGQTEVVAATVARRPALARAFDTDGQTPLHLAAQFNDPQIAAILVAYGADVSARFGDSGHSVLSWAVTCNAIECARALVKLGAEPDLFCAAGIGSLDHLKAFFETTDPPAVSLSQTGSSRYAADGTRLPCPPTTLREQISDALYIASRNAQADVVRFLLTLDPDLSFRAYLGGTPLHWAHFGGSRTVVDLLEQAGADPNDSANTMNCLPRPFGICVAASWGIEFIVQKLLANDPTLVNPENCSTSPLHQAASAGHVRIVQLLLERGASSTLRDADGRTALDLAVALGQAEVIDLLKKRQGDL